MIGIAWSLLCEVLFYSIFALAILNRKLGLAVMGWLVGTIVREAFDIRGVPFLGYFFPGAVLNFMCGAVIAYVVATRGRSRYLGWFAALGIFGLTAIPHLLIGPAIFVDDPLWLKLVYIASSAAVVIGCVSLDVAKPSAPRLLVKLGNASYSLYLFHWVVGWVLDGAFKRFDVYDLLPIPVMFMLLIVGMIGFSYAAYLIVERPLLDLAQAYWQHLTNASNKTLTIQGQA